jgi:signal transduction histidine kinase
LRGDELVAAVRADSDLATTPILVLTARADDQAGLDLLQAGVNDYLPKPFGVDELRARVGNLVSVRQAENRARAVRMSNERDRIARDLHDVVIQRLFALGMRLDSVLRHAPADGVVQQRISETVEELDNVIRDIRSTIFDLQRPVGAQDGLRSQVMALCAAAGDQVGCTPRVGFDGAVDTLVDGPVAQQLLAVLQEALSNVVRHAYASMIDVVLATVGGRVVLTVRDDGVGPNDQASAGNGLRNMASRAELLGGQCVVASNEPIGTMVRWWAPLVPG